MKKYIMALDAGTTSNRCILFTEDCRIAAMAQQEFRQYYPKPGWVEHDADEIFESILSVARSAMFKAGASADDIAAIGIANQRETAIVWDAVTGAPIYHAIVWQCRRTSEYCDSLKAQGYGDMIRDKTGLLPDAYFAGTKFKWILDHVPGAREKAENGELMCGTVESYLIFRLTGGKSHVTDYSNASRTMLFNIHTLQWDEEILKLIDIPRRMLPKPVENSGLFGKTAPELFGSSIPIYGAAGDQQAALFGQTCFDAGDVKNTYGTGCFMLMNTGENAVKSENGLVTTIAWGMNGKVSYALEGSVFVAGAVIQWLRDELHLISSSAESEECALRVSDTQGCYLVPAFVGLGAPYWNQHARGTITGLTRGCGRDHIVRAALESMAYQTAGVLDAMERDSGMTFDSLRVDGGASANGFLMQFQSDIIHKTVLRPDCIETTALGAAYLAGLGCGFYPDQAELKRRHSIAQAFKPVMKEEKRLELIAGWKRAVNAVISWADQA